MAFPNRPCPKCGEPIHIKSKSHEACGWTAAASASPAKAAAASSQPKSKMEAVRWILAESGKDAKPLDIQSQLKKKYNIKMDPTVISTYKGTILRQGSPKKLGRPKGNPAPKASHAGSISIEDIQAVKSLAERLGADKLWQLAEVLAK